MKGKKFVSTLALGLALAMLASSAVNFASLSTSQPSWANTLMSNITISGLFRDGEHQVIYFVRCGGWSQNVQDVCFYEVWRKWCNGTYWQWDLQAHIELVNYHTGYYIMEIYHSWDTLQVSMPYTYTVVKEETLALILNITASI